MAKKRRPKTMMETALRGAAAGVAGGLVVALAEREVLTWIAGEPRHESHWDDWAERALASAGLKPRRGGVIAFGVTTQIACAGALGAAYAVLSERTKESRGGSILADSALNYAAGLLFPARPTRRDRVRSRSLRKKLVRRGNTAAAFSRATSMALSALLR